MSLASLKVGLELAVNFNSDVLDKSGNGRNGAITGMTFDTATPMIESGSGEFAINDYIEIDVASSPQSDILDLTTGQISLWFRFSDIVDEFKRLFNTAQGLAFPDGDEWGINWVSGNKINVFCVNSGSVIMSASTPTLIGATDDDKHLVIIKANTSGNIIIKFDDVTQILSSSPLGAKFFGHAVDSNNMAIGAIIRAAVSALGSKDLDALNIWSAVKTDAEDTELWNGGAGLELEVSEGGVGALVNNGLINTGLTRGRLVN